MLDALGSMEASYGELQGRVGFPVKVLDGLLEKLVAQGELRMRGNWGNQLYCAANPGGAAVQSSVGKL